MAFVVACANMTYAHLTSHGFEVSHCIADSKLQYHGTWPYKQAYFVQVSDPALQIWPMLQQALMTGTDTGHPNINLHAVECAFSACRLLQQTTSPPSQLLNHIEAMATILQYQTSLSGWMRNNFPMGLLLALLLHSSM